jgi:L-lactate dehydrogenase complex protein LldE
MEKPDKVFFFGTCLIDMAFPEAGMAAIRLIRREGVEVVFPQEQSCCGQPAYNSGFSDEAAAVALKQIRVFKGTYPIVVPSGSCAGMMKLHYPEMFAGTAHEAAARRFADRVVELSTFLARILKVRLTDRGAPVKVTWHSSCHAMREMGAVADSKALIGQLSKVELVPLTREEECCGFGGTFSVKQPAISAAMVEDKVNDIVGSGAATVLAGDCGCLLNINGAMAYRGLPIVGKHLAEFIWERTDGNHA